MSTKAIWGARTEQPSPQGHRQISRADPAQQTTQPLATYDGSIPTLRRRLDDELILEALMVAFVVVVSLECADRPAQLGFANQDHAVEAR